MTVQVIQGDCREALKTLPDESVHMVCTSPPYFGLRDYKCDGQIGLEETPGAYVAEMVAVFREVRRVLRNDGTVWLNLGDSYARQAGDDSTKDPDSALRTGRTGRSAMLFKSGNNRPPLGLKPKDLIGIPWRCAFALQADGWYLRSDIVWAKKSPMPESVTDRPTRSHEFVFLLSKKPNYYYDAASIAEPAVSGANGSSFLTGKTGINGGGRNGLAEREDGSTRNRRDVWLLNPEPYGDAHFAVMPTKLVEPCILAGCPIGGTILDPFAGSGTVGVVATRHHRNAILIELNPSYCELIHKRLDGVQVRLPLEAI